MGRFIGLDIHRDFAQVAIVEDGVLTDAGKVDCRPEALREWAAGLTPPGPGGPGGDGQQRRRSGGAGRARGPGGRVESDEDPRDSGRRR